MSDHLNFPQFSDSPLRGELQDYTTYTRPNYGNILSPIQSDQYSLEIYEKERKARKRIRRLLNEQTEINDALADENDLLTQQQESLVQLLSNKDRQLQSLAASLNSSSISSLKQKISGCTKGAQTFELEGLKNLFVGREKRAWKKLMNYVKTAGLKDAELKSAVELSRCAVLSMSSVLKGRIQAQTASFFYRLFKDRPSRLAFRKLNRVAAVIKANSLMVFRHRIQTAKVCKAVKLAQLKLCLMSYGDSKLGTLKAFLLRWRSVKSSELVIARLFKLLKQPCELALRRWTSETECLKLQALDKDRTDAQKKAAMLSEKFLRLSSLNWVSRTCSTRRTACALRVWRKATKRRAAHAQAAKVLSRLRSSVLKPYLKELLARPTNVLLCLVLKRVIRHKLLIRAIRQLDTFCMAKRLFEFTSNEAQLNEQLTTLQGSLRHLTIKSEDLKDEVSAAKIKLSKLDNKPNSPVHRLSQELDDKRQACAELAGKIESHLHELENYKAKTDREREALERDCKVMKEASAELKGRLHKLESEQNYLLTQLTAAEDGRKLNKIQLTHVQSTVKKLHQQIEDNLQEQEQTAVQEAECRRQLIKLTTQIDDLAGDKENLLEDVERLSLEQGRLKDRLLQLPTPAPQAKVCLM